MKNIEFLLRAFAALANRDAILVLLGEGSEGERLRQLAQELNISGRVRFPGWRSDTERFYSIATAFVLTSVYEPYGQVFAEALASGVPALGLEPSHTIKVATDEHIIDGLNGFIVSASDYMHLSARLDLLLSDPGLRERLSKEARKLAVQRYDWEVCAGAFAEDFTST